MIRAATGSRASSGSRGTPASRQDDEPARGDELASGGFHLCLGLNAYSHVACQWDDLVARQTIGDGDLPCKIRPATRPKIFFGRSESASYGSAFGLQPGYFCPSGWSESCVMASSPKRCL